MIDDEEVREEPVRQEPLEQSEIVTLEAELRAAQQQHMAALERVRETHAEIEALMERARALLARSKGDRD